MAISAVLRLSGRPCLVLPSLAVSLARSPSAFYSTRPGWSGDQSAGRPDGRQSNFTDKFKPRSNGQNGSRYEGRPRQDGGSRYEGRPRQDGGSRYQGRPQNEGGSRYEGDQRKGRYNDAPRPQDRKPDGPRPNRGPFRKTFRKVGTQSPPRDPPKPVIKYVDPAGARMMKVDDSVSGHHSRLAFHFPFSLRPRNPVTQPNTATDTQPESSTDASTASTTTLPSKRLPNAYPPALAITDDSLVAPFEYTGRYIPPAGWNRDKELSLTHELTEAQASATYPWLANVDNSLQPNERLEAEINAFADYVKPTPAEAEVQAAVAKRVTVIIKDVFNAMQKADRDRLARLYPGMTEGFVLQNPRVEVSGSFATGTASPMSDIDVSVFLPDPPALPPPMGAVEAPRAGSKAYSADQPKDQSEDTAVPTTTADTDSPSSSPSGPKPGPGFNDKIATLTAWRAPWIKTIYDSLYASEEFIIPVLVPNSRFPLVTAMHRNSRVPIQISFFHFFQRSMALEVQNKFVAEHDISLTADQTPIESTTKAVTHYLDSTPGLAAAFAVIKAGFEVRGLTDVYRKGVPSYALFMMTVAAAMRAQGVSGFASIDPTISPTSSDSSVEDGVSTDTISPCTPETSLPASAILLSFLNLFSKFDTRSWGISLQPPVYFRKYDQHDPANPETNSDRKFDPEIPLLPEFLRTSHPVYPYRLCIIDPSNPRNDMGYQFLAIKHVMETLKECLSWITSQTTKYQSLSESDVELKSDSVHQPILAHFIGAVDGVYNSRRVRMKEWAEFRTAVKNEPAPAPEPVPSPTPKKVKEPKEPKGKKSKGKKEKSKPEPSSSSPDVAESVNPTKTDQTSE